ncbi:MAG: response regulator [Cytophagales bacterium]
MVAIANKYKKIVLIDDNPVDNLISMRYINASKIANECIAIDSSLDAYDYFDELNVSEFPEVILLDLNMPMYSGFEFLDKIEKMVDSHQISSKVYILSSSSNPVDIKRASTYKSVADYFVKPLNADLVSKIS